MTEFLKHTLDPATAMRRQLGLLIADNHVDVLVFSRAEDNSLTHERVMLDISHADHVTSLEDMVYNNPLLLSDFSHVDVLFDTRRFMVVPAEAVDASPYMLEQLYAGDNIDVIASEINDAGTVIAAAVDPRLSAFVRRTFHNPGLHHRLAPMARWFGLRNRLGNSSKLHLHLTPGRLDILGYHGRDMSIVNTFEVRSELDALYYAQAIADLTGFDTNSDQMFLSGDSAMREKAMPLMRKYFSYVMPVIFPSDMFRAGSDALRAPFELVSLHN